ncbi:MAG: prolyl aminopeptidase [Candidatus Cyclobacteriaceae bacterium M3_2C_046]
MVQKLINSGYLSVGKGHQLYWETYGKPTGIPVLFLHGGPGNGFSEQDRQFFDPDLFFVIFFDQRGCGRSKPYACLEHNTTHLILQDIETLLNYLKINKCLLLGGSWGSTLSLLFAIKNPDKVQGMILRGVFPAHKAAHDHFIQGGTASYFPEVWQRFIDPVPPLDQEDIARFYFNQMQSEDQDIRTKYAYEWAHYGTCLARMDFDMDQVKMELHQEDYLAPAVLQAYYASHQFFLPENYIYHHLKILKDIPIRIIQGRYDLVCPPIFAWEIHQQLSQSELFLVIAGHAATEPAIDHQLKLSLRELVRTIG